MSLFTRKIPRLVAEEITIYDILAATRVTQRVSRAEMAARLDRDMTYILDFEGGKIDARLSELRYYAFALGVGLEFRVSRYGEEDTDAAG